MKISPAIIQVRFRDCDLLGHVNNAVYLNYFEQTRLHYFGKLIGKNWDYTKQGMVLVRNEIDYIKPIFLNDIPEISLSLKHLGTKSFTLSYEIKVDGELRTIGTSTLVCIDGETHKSVLVFPDFKEALEQL